MKSQLQYLLAVAAAQLGLASFNTGLRHARAVKRLPQYSALQRWYQREPRRGQAAGPAFTLPRRRPNPTL